MLALLALLACSSTPTAAPQPKQELWLQRVAQTPDAFQALMEAPAGGVSSRDGWLALANGEPRAALADFTAAGNHLGELRAKLDIGLLTSDLNRLERRIVARVKERLAERPAGSSAALEQTVAVGKDCAVALATPPAAFAARAASHSAPWSLGAEPFATEQAEDYVRRTWDPCVAYSLAQVTSPDGTAAALELQGLADDDPLGASLFAAWPTAAKAASASSDLLGAAPPTAAADDPQAALDHIRSFDTALQALSTSMDGQPGAGLVRDALLANRLEQAWLLAQARVALNANRPHQALVYANRALNPGAGADAPPPPLDALVLHADAALASGRTREALDSLLQLARRGPPVATGLHELTSDLAVLEGLGRQGDSRED